MAEVAEVVNDVQPVEKETEKKAVDVDDVKADKKEKDAKPKENGKGNEANEANEKSEAETNGSAETTEVAATKRKSGSGTAPEGTPAEGVTPEKKAKISNEENEKESTNGESEVASEGDGEAKNMSYQKH